MRVRNYIAAILALLISHGCATADRYVPSAHAETPVQHAYALHATFDVLLERAAEIADDPRTPDTLAAAIGDAKDVGVPAVESMLQAVLAVETVRQAADAGEEPPERVDAALRALEQEIARLRPVVTDLIRVVTQ